jgi:hypothetical protein
MNTDAQAQFVVCINNEGYPASLELRKIYRPSTMKRLNKLTRVVDELGEDYLYPERFFVPIQIAANRQRSVPSCLIILGLPTT